MKHHFRSQQKYHCFVASKTPFTRRYKNVPPFLIGGETFQDLQDQYEEPIQFEAKKIDPEDEEEEELEDAK